MTYHTKKKRPAEAGRLTGDAIPGGAEETDPLKERPSQEKNSVSSLAAAKRVIAYIDGFNLYFGMKSKGWKRYYWLDLRVLCSRLLKSDQVLVGTKYFTSRITATPGDPHEPQRQNRYLEALVANSGVGMAYGHYLPKKAQCRNCGHVWQTFEEKQTDVNIAIEMLADAHADAFDMALLISADSDLSAPLEKIRLLFPSKRLIVAFPPDRRSGQLTKLAHGSFTIGEANLRQSQLPDPVFKGDGFALSKPPHWK